MVLARKSLPHHTISHLLIIIPSKLAPIPSSFVSFLPRIARSISSERSQKPLLASCLARLSPCQQNSLFTLTTQTDPFESILEDLIYPLDKCLLVVVLGVVLVEAWIN
ncbi:hypothetical protein NIES3804_25240 [Microcystis aeruginosa NIES-3804]|uniref:Uncharacterized protein n=1 Tax=Microcystis aeruginosa NIES-3804 TaxID=2517783 RepID=A0A6H9G700_MICAE|nr:hypothetical protein NIES3804_25240 [Microcystis aeruginosa NIES-3804]